VTYLRVVAAAWRCCWWAVHCRASASSRFSLHSQWKSSNAGDSRSADPLCTWSIQPDVCICCKQCSNWRL